MNHAARNGHPRRRTAAPADAALPTQRTSPQVPAASPAATTVLVAYPGRSRRTTLAAGLLDGGIGRVLQAASMADIDELLAHRHGGDVALVSLAFHLDRERLIPDLLGVGWLRVIVLVGTADPGQILTAVRAGATGVLRAAPVLTTRTRSAAYPPTRRTSFNWSRTAAPPPGSPGSWRCPR